MSNFLRLYTYINIKYSFKLAFAKDPIWKYAESIS